MKFLYLCGKGSSHADLPLVLAAAIQAELDSKSLEHCGSMEQKSTHATSLKTLMVC
jgi:hypothetical protein